MKPKSAGFLSGGLAATVQLRLFGWWKVPLIAWVRPRVINLDDQECILEIPFLRRNRNHLGSVYFGVLCVGADCVGGMLALRLLKSAGHDLRSVSLVFKDFKAEFLKRPYGTVRFVCRDGAEIGRQVQETVRTGERVGNTLKIDAFCKNSKTGEDELVSKFELNLTLKKSVKSLKS